MNPGQTIDLIFKGVKWTGGSPIHRSRSSSKQLPKMATPQLMKMIMNKKVGNSLWYFMQQNFSKGEWLLDEHEFVDLFHMDVWGWLSGGGSSTSKLMLKNPNTGNVFHRIALYPSNIVGGIRFWVENHHHYQFLGFRFRLEVMSETEEKIRHSIRETVELAATVSAEIKEMLEVSAPYEEELVKVRVKEEE